jgi:hypothetical protein
MHGCTCGQRIKTGEADLVLAAPPITCRILGKRPCVATGIQIYTTQYIKHLIKVYIMKVMSINDIIICHVTNIYISLY